jgi:hypothetical protein
MNGLVKVISWVCLSRWGFEALITKEALKRTADIPNPLTQDTTHKAMTEFLQDKYYLMEQTHFNFNIVVILMWGLLFLTSVVVILKLRDRIK